MPTSDLAASDRAASDRAAPGHADAPAADERVRAGDEPAPYGRPAGQPAGTATGRYFADVAPGWVERYATRRSFRQRLRVVGDVVEPLLAGRAAPLVLDLGGGPGIFSVLCARHGATAVDLDPSAAMLGAGLAELPRMTALVDAALPAVSRAATAGGVRFVAGTLDALSPAADGRFDLVLAVAVLEYLDDPYAALDRVRRLLAPGGAVVLTVPRQRALPRRAERALTPLARAAQAAVAGPAAGAGRRLRERAYTDLRPYGDRVPWRQAAAAAGLAVDLTRPLPLGDQLPWRQLCPNEVVVLRPAAPARPADTVHDRGRPRPTADDGAAGGRPGRVETRARALAERATHRLVLRRRLPPPYQAIRFYVSSEAGLKYLRRTLADVDPTLTGLVGETVRPGAVVWDIGANVGLFSFAAAAAAGPDGHVLAVEPDTWLVGLLRRSAALPGRRAPVEVLASAIGESTGVSRFCIAARNRATSHLAGYGHRAQVRAVQPVPTLTLDDLLAHAPAPDVLKIDVEGAELLVLSGGRRLLATARPVVVCEVAAANSAAVHALLTEHGYRVLDGDVPPPHRVPLPAAPWTTLAVPVGARPVVPSRREPPGVRAAAPR